MADVPWRALAALAAAEIRRSWRSLVAIGLLAGLAGAAVVGAAAGARRTATAYDRLRKATLIDDVRVVSFDPVPLSEVQAMPEVVAARRSAVGVGQIAGRQVRYIAIQSLEPESHGVFEPILVRGRAARADVAGEAVMFERVAMIAGIRLGDVLRLMMLTPDEVRSFATGFGDPDGPAVQLRITGLVRMPGPAVETAPILASPAFAARHPSVMSGTIAYLRLRDGVESIPATQRGLDRLTADLPRTESPLPPADLVRPDDSDPTIRATAQILARGLLVFAAVAGAVGLLSAALSLLRYHSGSAADQGIELSLGLTSGERVGARVLGGGLSAATAAVVTAAGGLALAAIDPLGPAALLEPQPGWSPHVSFILAGAAMTGAATVALIAFSARRSGRPERVPLRTGRRRSPPGAPWFTIGVRFALERGRGHRHVSGLPSLAGVVVGVLGVLGCAVFAASRDGLVSERARWGWTADLAVRNATRTTVDRLVADERLQDVSIAGVTKVRVNGVDVTAYAVTPVKGSLGWTFESGPGPMGASEVTLGRRLAERLGKGPGDAVTVGGQRFSVVGVGYGPSLARDRFGDNLLVTADGLEQVRRSAPDQEAIVRFRAGTDVGALTRELGADLEVAGPEPPSEVVNLAALGRLPTALGACLALIAVGALSHLLLVTTRRRARELAVLRVLGFTPTQAASSILVTAVTTGVVGAGIGIVIGVAAGRLMWNAVVAALGIDAPADVRGAVIVLVAIVTPLAAVVVAALPARRASAVRPAVLLREE